MSAFRQQLIDYVYGELPEAERTEVEARLAQSEDDRRELADLQLLLRGARQVLQDNPEPPARVRAALLVAAREALAARPLAAAAREERGGVQGAVRWLQARFLIPSLAMAAAAAWLVFLRPELRPPEREHAAAESDGMPPAAAPLPAPPSAPRAASEAAPAAAAPAAELAGAKQEGAAVEPASARRGRAATASRDLPSSERKVGAVERARAAADSSGVAPAAPAVAEREAAADSSSLAKPAASSRGAAAPGGFAVPPPGWAGQATAAPADESGGEARARSEAPEGLGALDPGAGAANAPLAMPALVRRAREHMTAQRWAAAAADYRELLRRFPRRPEASSWKRQLERAQQAQP